MKKIVCEMCDSMEFIKQDGLFVCQSCGLKYSLEEAKKMMREVGDDVPVAAPAAPAQNKQMLLENYLTMAQNALEAENNAEAESYANKIIELDACHAEAWFIKGKAAGWQTTGRVNRYPEAITAWINAHQFASEEDKVAMDEKIHDEAHKIGFAIVLMECNSFSKFVNKENANDILNAREMVQKQLDALKEKTGVDVYTDAFKTQLARQMNSAAVNGSNKADSDFGPERSDKTKYAWDRFIEAYDACLILLSKAYDLTADDDLCHTICKNYIVLGETVRDSCSYKYDYDSNYGSRYVVDYTFTADAKRRRSSEISEWEDKRDRHDPAKRRENMKIVISYCKKAIEDAEKKEARIRYWATRQEEKKALDAEMTKLNKERNQLGQQKRREPVYKEKQDIESEISSLKVKMAGLGIFKAKEKKLVQADIDKAQMRMRDVETRIMFMEGDYLTKTERIEKRLAEIKATLTRDCGRVPLSGGEAIALCDSEGNFAYSPMELLGIFADCACGEYGVKSRNQDAITNYSEVMHNEIKGLVEMAIAFGGGGDIEPMADYVDDPNTNKIYRIPFYYYDIEEDENLESMGHANTSATSIRNKGNFIYFELNSGYDVWSAEAFTFMVSRFLCKVMPSLHIETVQKFIAQNIYGFAGLNVLTSDGYKIEIVRNDNVTIHISKL